MAAQPSRTHWRDKTIDQLHEEGAKRFEWAWITANERAIAVARECGFDPINPGPNRWQIALLCSAVATVICEAELAAKAAAWEQEE